REVTIPVVGQPASESLGHARHYGGEGGRGQTVTARSRRHRAWRARSSALIGSESMEMPAARIASAPPLAMAAGAPMGPPPPIHLTPVGVSGDGVSACAISKLGRSWAFGSA